MALVYLPTANSFFLWGKDTALRELPGLARDGKPTRAELVVPEGRRTIEGLKLLLFEATAKLAVVPAATLDLLPGSIATWVLASKLGIELVSRERIVGHPAH